MADFFECWTAAVAFLNIEGVTQRLNNQFISQKKQKDLYDQKAMGEKV